MAYRGFNSNLRLLMAIGAAAILIGASPASAVTYIQGFDVYTGDGAVNWATAKAGGYDFAFVKATEGVNFVDSRFTTNMSGANSAGAWCWREKSWRWATTPAVP